MRNKLVAGNWKMNMTSPEAAATVEAFVSTVELHPEVDVAICPPFTAIPKVHALLAKTRVAIGAQDCFWKEEGAFTGQISPKMLQAEGVTMCIVGHSETRGKFGKLEIPESTLGFFAETDETINLKMRALLFHSITPILCVGETLAERKAGATDRVVSVQLDGALSGFVPDELENLVVAYEPVWAIGTGEVCESGEANRVCAMIRGWLNGRLGEAMASTCRVLYGGSVKPGNARELFHQPSIDGGLVGGASLHPVEFAAVVAAAGR